MTYAGDISVEDCWKILADEPTAQLVDVRTAPEWTFVGVPRLDSISKQTIFVEWQQFPTMEVNTHFVDQVEAKLADPAINKDTSFFMLCRSGARSISAAQAMTQAGYSKVFNVLDGFEGDKDSAGHRGTVAGWKFSQKPWSQ